MADKKSKLDTRLEAAGAEFLVLGQLLVAKIAAYKAYTNMPGYDVVAFDPKVKSLAKISVKSRWNTDADSLLLKTGTDCDFVVVVRLNRGSKDGKLEVKAPEFHVISASDLHDVPRMGKMNRVLFKKIPDFEKCKDCWSKIREFLNQKR